MAQELDNSLGQNFTTFLSVREGMINDEKTNGLE